MKIRTDFVTNSSSSNFIALKIKNKVLSSYLKESESFLEFNYLYDEEKELGGKISDDEIRLESEGGPGFPNDCNELINNSISLLKGFIYDDSLDIEKVLKNSDFIKFDSGIVGNSGELMGEYFDFLSDEQQEMLENYIKEGENNISVAQWAKLEDNEYTTGGNVDLM